MKSADEAVRAGRRNALAAAAVALLALAAPSAALAAGSQFYASTTNPAQAVIIDLATKTQSGSMLSFAMGLLRKTPAHARDADIYWADGVLQIECLGHQTRYKLVSSFTLDRSRRFDEPSPAFQPWSDNALGSPARALEEFLCRGRADGDFTPIASLSDFAAAFVGGRAVAQTSPPAPAGEPASPAPPPPAGLAPYYLFGSNKDSADLFDLGHVRRTGDFAFTTRITLLAKPEKMAGDDVYWAESTEEFDCVQHRYRDDANMSLLTLDRRVVAGDSGDAKFGAWAPDDPNTNGLALEDLVCRGKVHGGQIAVFDLTAFQRQFFASLKRQ